MTPLTWFLARHAVIGFCIAGLFSAVLFGFDIASLRSLVAQSDAGMIAAAALTFMLCLTFGSVQMGVAVMLMERDTGRGGGKRIRFAPVRIPASGALRYRAISVRSR